MINFETHNDKNINCGGTSLVDYIIANYADLKKVFGKPTKGDEYKSDAEWEIEFEDGVVATIYNWKDGKNYCGSSGLPKTKITEWHIGSFDKRGSDNVQLVLSERLQVK